MNAKTLKDTKADLKKENIKEDWAEGDIVYCKEDSSYYKFDPTTLNSETGFFVKLAMGGSNNSSSNIDLASSTNDGLLSNEDYDLLQDIRNEDEYFYIKDTFRDHSDIANGSMNNVSVFYQYLGWYVFNKSNGTSSKVDDLGKYKRFYQPTFLRLAGDSTLTIESITKEHLSSTHQDSKRKQAYCSYALVVSETDHLNNGITYTNTKGVTKEVKAKSVGCFYTTPIINNAYHNGSVLQAYDKDIIIVSVDWNTLPEDAYIQYGVIKMNGDVNYRFSVIHTDKPVSSADIVSSNPQPLTEVDGMYLDTTNLKRPDKRYSTFILEGSAVNSTRVNSTQGLLFNVYVPEMYWKEIVKDTNNHLYLKDIKDLGKLYNGITSLQEYTYLPFAPKQGDMLKVVNTLTYDTNTPNTTNEFICLQGWINYSKSPDIGRTASSGIHINTLQNRYPITPILDEEALNFYLGKNTTDAYKVVFRPLN